MTALDQNAERVEVTVENEAGETRRYKAAISIGSDGGNSFVRDALGIPL